MASKEQIREWLDTIIEEAESELSPWEHKFITDVEDQLTKNITLSPRQEQLIEKIYDEKCP